MDKPEKNVLFYTSGGRRSILIVEDEPINCELLRFMLQQDYELIFATNGKDALEKLDAAAEKLSIVLLDLNLPDMMGQDILRRMKSDARLGRLPVIVMTSDQDAEVECLTLGAIDFIPKPYPQQDVVLARIRRTIELSEDRDIIRWTERDSLTGLYNPQFFFHYAGQFDVHHEDTPTDAILIDINNFHMVNERYGWKAGDEVLKKIAEKLLEAVEGTGGIACRRSADTFLIYCPHRGDYQDILSNSSVELGDSGHVRLRMGIYENTDKNLQIERRFDRAKLAADTVKDNFAGSAAIYDDRLYDEEILAEQLIDGFDAAIKDKEFLVCYQPKFDVQTEVPVLSGAEALIRWKHPGLGMVSPGVFIPLFEKNGLIRRLDAYVWHEAARQVRAWKDEIHRNIKVSVNVSRIDLYDQKLPEKMYDLLEEFDLDTGDIVLEITESAYTDDSGQILDVVNRLREKGFHIQMDDFGTGYSSLNMISTLPIDAMKLDMEFIRNALKGHRETLLLEAVIGLARALGLPTIAEGVETEEQMSALKSMGCDTVQGYYFSKPLPPDEFEAYVSKLDHPTEEAE